MSGGTQGAGAQVVFLAAARTPFGTYGGTLRDLSAVDLGVIAARAAIERGGIAPTDVTHTIFGTVLFTDPDSAYTARHIGLLAGCRIESPALSVNRLCGSGFQAIVSGATEILLDQAEICLVGGTESMSRAPHVGRGLRWGVPLGAQLPLADSLWEALTDASCDLPMAETAENLARRHGLTRADADAFALRSQQLAREGWASGAFANEIIEVPVRHPKTGATESFARDEHMRPQTTAEGLAALKPAFRPDGTVTAGNASGIGDGAGALILASERTARVRGVRPLGKLVSWGVAGVDPTIMGIGPVPAARAALANAGLTLDQMDMIEVNEAFAVQVCAVERELGIPRDRLNVHGGAVALSHPLGASGARITAHLLHTLRRTGQRYGLGAACIGGGQGIAVIVEAG